ncbi:alpha/beta hydrolase family protein [Bifidobacterium felsineum]|uniref:Alpha/beta hydrolase n=1 Tax=Bifidobacterium felsineum TaxID=2045440 RepID=A0A2M9HM82_9BIFI|nr:alpha/beta hydrolase [Bifidobacterium felsineum]MBT1163396.1 alpha/beta hydrolase [Bifidobacterium felsineum]PJM77927.1 alpha/beta hydrolase [Bifidobacterium felsineum]
MKRVAHVGGIALILLLICALLGWGMMPRWDNKPYTGHIAVASASPAILPAQASIAHEGQYKTRETQLSIDIGGGVSLPAVLREPVNAPGPRPACLFIHGSGTSGAEDFGDIANAMASAGIVTLVPAKSNENYTIFHRDYPRFASEYGKALDVLHGIDGVDQSHTGIYAESEGTWIATILASERHDIAFAALTSAPVFKGREQMAMAMSTYAHEAGAPKPVIEDTMKLLSLDYRPFGLQYADFDADYYLKSLTMPVLVSYGVYDTAMPIEQGAQRIMRVAASNGNNAVTVRYFAGNHQMRAGKGLFVPGLPLADGYTQALENWVNGVSAGASVSGWSTPQVAGAAPSQQYEAPRRTNSGIIGSLGVLVGVMLAGPILLGMALLLGLIATVRAAWLERDTGIVHMRGKRAALYAVPPSHAQRTAAVSVGEPCWGLGLSLLVSSMLLYVYLAAVGAAAVFAMTPAPGLFDVGWHALQVIAVVVVIILAWSGKTMWSVRHGITGVQRATCWLVLAAAAFTLLSMAFWGLFGWW